MGQKVVAHEDSKKDEIVDDSLEVVGEGEHVGEGFKLEVEILAEQT